MSVLSAERRKDLVKACVQGRRAAEAACRAAVGSLALLDERPPGHLSESDRDLRRGLRAKRQQLGDEGDRIDLLVADCAYEQWHRLLFARFLAENGLLIHPEYRAPVTLEECEELATDLGEPDGWAVAGRFAAEILPGIFRLDDPCVRVRLAPEGRLALEQIVASLSAEVFVAGDALGWVYQFWQKEKKDEVNASERKIGGADLAPVTQLFTENYMVRFLLENSLGAWWASRHPESPLVKSWKYLRFDDDDQPVAGSFDGWPTSVAEVKVMDPCCGSGHFLVEALEMLWQMRAEEQGLAPVAAQDSVLRDNLFGLELDPRCVQIAMFAVALTAWKAGEGWRQLPVPNIACSGIPVKARGEEWTALAAGDVRLENALGRLHVLFRDADSLGSLIDPRRATEIADGDGRQRSLEEVDWEELVPFLEAAAKREGSDPATAVLGADAAALARAADLLSRRYTLVATNVPYLSRQAQGEQLREFSSSFHPAARADLATTVISRCLSVASTVGVVAPQNWQFLAGYLAFRREVLSAHTLVLSVRLGSGAFAGITGEVVKPVLAIIETHRREAPSAIGDVSQAASIAKKQNDLQSGTLLAVTRQALLDNPNSVISARAGSKLSLLDGIASSTQGLITGDNSRYLRYHWEVPAACRGWERVVTTPDSTSPYTGRNMVLDWSWETQNASFGGELARVQGHAGWGKPGVVLSRVGDLCATLSLGEIVIDKGAAVVPKSERDVPSLWQFLSSREYDAAVREVDAALAVSSGSLVRVPFDAQRWHRAADEAGPLPEPRTDDPTQWLFGGRPETATDPLQVAVGRLLGYRWLEQPDTADLDELADGDGIVCLPSVLGERTAAARVHELLSRTFGGTWSPGRAGALLMESGSKKSELEPWLRDEFFKAHCQVFKNRPFVWHIWDGRKDGFAALVNYHRLDQPTLERLTYTYLGDWSERQTAGVREDVAGAEERLAAAKDLQRRLELILAGEPPHDIYVRWKTLAEQPIGWDPDLNDGVRLNVRPFVEAGVLRAKFNVKWGKDRGKNLDGSERLNNLHLTIAEKQAARTRGRT